MNYLSYSKEDQMCICEYIISHEIKHFFFVYKKFIDVSQLEKFLLIIILCWVDHKIGWIMK